MQGSRRDVAAEAPGETAEEGAMDFHSGVMTERVSTSHLGIVGVHTPRNALKFPKMM